MIMVMLPQGATMHETMNTLGEVSQYLQENEPVKYVYEVGGFSFYGTGASSSMILRHYRTGKNANMPISTCDRLSSVSTCIFMDGPI